MLITDKLFVEYPVPRDLSIWGGDGVIRVPLESIDNLIATAVDELSSDILITDYMPAFGMGTLMPEDTVTCTAAMLSSDYPFQGNRLLKVTYDRASRTAYLRYYPATITYQRYLRVEDLDTLKGDRLIYFKAYCLWKMAEKEASILRTVNLSVDNATIDLSILESFRDKMNDRYKDLKEQILIYATVN